MEKEIARLTKLKKASCLHCKKLHPLSKHTASQIDKGETINWTRLFTDCDSCAKNFSDEEERTHF